MLEMDTSDQASRGSLSYFLTQTHHTSQTTGARMATTFLHATSCSWRQRCRHKVQNDGEEECLAQRLDLEISSSARLSHPMNARWVQPSQWENLSPADTAAAQA
jgi:hypothetical protein